MFLHWMELDNSSLLQKALNFPILQDAACCVFPSLWDCARQEVTYLCRNVGGMLHLGVGGSEPPV